MSETKPRVGFVGLGLMGAGMARNIAKAGFPITIYNRTRSKADDLAAEIGARVAETPRAAADGADIVISIVSDVPDVESVYLTPETGIIAGLKPGAVAIDMSTVGAECARRIGEAVASAGGDFLDAPVSGGSWGAVNGTLSIMSGGSEAGFAAAMPVFDVMGKKIIHCGPIGTGQTTKMVNQIVGALNLEAAAEGILLAQKAGLTIDKALEAVGGGAAASWAWTNLAPRMSISDFAPGFKVAHQIKDLKLALEAAREVGIALPGTELVLANLLKAQSTAPDGGERGTQSVIEALR